MRRVWVLTIVILFCSALVSLRFDASGGWNDAPTQTPPQVLVSIKPLHSLVASVMEGAGKPQLLIPGGVSPHHYNLRPSDALALHDADLVFWMGDALETGLAKSVRTLSSTSRSFAVTEIENLHLLPARGGDWEAHRHGIRAEGRTHAIDPHLWLDPNNAIRIVQAITEVLIESDPAHAEVYRTNAAKTIERIERLDNRLREQLDAVEDLPYVVFHDAYRYFEDHYALNAVGAITLHPEVPAGIGQIRTIHDRIRELGVRCLFREPQFRPALIDTLAEDTGVYIGVLDPIGAEIPAGPDAWFTVLKELGDSLKRCLSQSTR